MSLKSFGMLLPCGIDVFSGVEFVCCPRNTNSRVANTNNRDCIMVTVRSIVFSCFSKGRVLPD